MIGNYSDLKNKTFLVTGASSGIGQAVAVALNKQGATLVVTGRNSERLHETLAQLNDKANAIIADLTVEAERHALIDQLPMLDGVCHAAGIISPFPIRYIDEKQFDKVFDINAKSPILLTSRLLGKKKFNEEASIVFVSSIASDRAMKGGSVYSASKAAIEAFSKSIALEHTSKKIRANCLRPGLVKTSIFDQAVQLREAAHPNESQAEVEASLAPSLGSSEDVANAVLFLLSSASSWITSTDLVMDGGYSARI